MIRGKLETELKKGIKQAGVIALENEKKEAPVGVSGYLRKSIRMRLENGGLRAVIQPGLSEKVEYAEVVHEGGKPRYVSVRKGSALRLWAERRGINPYALQKSIAKHGTKANKYVERASSNSEEKINQVFTTALNNALKK